MSAHTPGPWVAVPPSIKGGPWRIETDPESERTLAFVESGQPNALAMAAAPELLAACVDLLNHSPYAPPDPNGGCECGAFVDYVPFQGEAPSCHHTRAQAAIAKAQGL